jgi:hypothetical protein
MKKPPVILRIGFLSLFLGALTPQLRRVLPLVLKGLTRKDASTPSGS